MYSQNAAIHRLTSKISCDTIHYKAIHYNAKQSNTIQCDTTQTGYNAIPYKAIQPTPVTKMTKINDNQKRKKKKRNDIFLQFSSDKSSNTQTQNTHTNQNSPYNSDLSGEPLHTPCVKIHKRQTPNTIIHLVPIYTANYNTIHTHNTIRHPIIQYDNRKTQHKATPYNPTHYNTIQP